MKILFVNTKKQQCGVHQYGLGFYNAIKSNGDYDIEYLAADSFSEVDKRGSEINCDIIIYNFHPGALKFVNENMARKYNVTSIALIHEPKLFNFSSLDDKHIFQYALYGDCGQTDYLDKIYNSAGGKLFPIKRIIFDYKENETKPSIPTFGTIGFAVLSKGFDKIINLVQKEFDEAIIRFNIPMNNSVVDDEASARKYDDYFISLVKKPGIKLEITHDFHNEHDFIKYLSKNSVNLFPYEYEDGHGALSSSFDNALMSKAPVAITKSAMFRHVLAYDLPITLENHSLKQIIEQGNKVLQPLYEDWSISNFNINFKTIIRNIINMQKNITKFNRILDDSARLDHSAAIERLFEISPDMMSRKEVRANVQQGFSLDVIEYCLNKMNIDKKDAQLLCIGSHEDTCCDAMKRMGYNITEVEPLKNYDLNTFYNLQSTEKNHYDVVFSISVLEHVENDKLFMQQAKDLLKHGGYGVFTVDYNDIPNAPLPRGNCKFYTQVDIVENILPILSECELLDNPEWECKNPDFKFDGVMYTFATLVFKKI